MLAKKGGVAICLSVVLLVGLISPYLIRTGGTESVKAADPLMPIGMPEIGETLGIGETLDNFLDGVITSLSEDERESIQRIIDEIKALLLEWGPEIDVGNGIAGVINAILDVISNIIGLGIDSIDMITDVISNIIGILSTVGLAIATPSWFVQIVDTIDDIISNIIGLGIDSVDMITDVISNIIGLGIDSVDMITDVISDIGIVVLDIIDTGFIMLETPSWLYVIVQVLVETIAGAGLGAIAFGIIGAIFGSIAVKFVLPINFLLGPLAVLSPATWIAAILMGLIFATMGFIINAP